jgi:hypothetical protein
MLPLRLLFAAIFLVSLPFGFCSSSDTSSEQTAALKAALIMIGDDPNNLPTIGQNFDCVIAVTNQPAAPASQFHNVSGSCLWTVEKQGSVWLVSFSETWFCNDWSAKVPNFPDCVPPNGTHEWHYQVDLRGGTTQLIENRGPFAPDQH